MSKRKRKRKRKQKRLEEMQAESYKVATTWWKSRVDLSFLGVDLGTCLVYPMMEAVNSITKREMAESESAHTAD